MCAHPPCSVSVPKGSASRSPWTSSARRGPRPAPARASARAASRPMTGSPRSERVAAGAASQVDAQRPRRDPSGRRPGPGSALDGWMVAPPTRHPVARRCRRWPGPSSVRLSSAFDSPGRPVTRRRSGRGTPTARSPMRPSSRVHRVSPSEMRVTSSLPSGSAPAVAQGDEPQHRPAHAATSGQR